MYDYTEEDGQTDSELIEHIEGSFNVKCINTVKDVAAKHDRTQRYILEFSSEGNQKICFRENKSA